MVFLSTTDFDSRGDAESAEKNFLLLYSAISAPLREFCFF